MKLITLENIKKTYGGKTVSLDISLDILKHESMVFMGTNGAGKSTLLKIITGLLLPSSGRVIKHVEPLHIGYVPERFPNLLRFTPLEYLTYMGRIQGIPLIELEKRIPILLERMALSHAKDKRIDTFSKGMVQKIGIIQSILRKPDLLILDEPLSGLDIHTQNELVHMMAEFKEEGITIILTYHESDLLLKIAERIVILGEGQIKGDYHIKDIDKPHIVIETSGIIEQVIHTFNGILHVSRKGEIIQAHVPQENSDQILLDILHQGGKIHSVGLHDPLKQLIMENYVNK
ncbi:ABC transporter ATP-binding protein [Virgibacillus soli]|uniref:ABC transporter ATP-binding protein n=1 Tax=Paracerasibacillus soli TaxID=480284 RepID=A0ABU5CWQ9_9BACI|nr:ABC transporter ATP-binding protein [Virgibacillus soli]MDY0409870.1 ABC transporter ATP-binding protein [Virgibacillus soli]